MRKTLEDLPEHKRVCVETVEREAGWGSLGNAPYAKYLGMCKRPAVEMVDDRPMCRRHANRAKREMEKSATNPAAVAQIKQARSNNMGKLKPTTVVRVTLTKARKEERCGQPNCNHPEPWHLIETKQANGVGDREWCVKCAERDNSMFDYGARAYHEYSPSGGTVPDRLPKFEKSDDMGWWQDNPGKRCEAGESHGHPDYCGHNWLKENPNTSTAGYRNATADPNEIAKIPGARGEEKRIDQTRVDGIAEHLKQHGFSKIGGPYIEVDHTGKPTISEGNHRTRAAIKLGLKTMPLEVRYFGGSEELPGVWKPGEMKKGKEIVGYGGQPHEHFDGEEPGDIRPHLANKHGWDDHDFERMKYRPGGERHTRENYARAIFLMHDKEHETDDERPRTRVPDALPGDIRDMKLSFAKSRECLCGHSMEDHNVTALGQHVTSHWCSGCASDDPKDSSWPQHPYEPDDSDQCSFCGHGRSWHINRGSRIEGVADGRLRNVYGTHCSLCRVHRKHGREAASPWHKFKSATRAPDQLPSDIREMKLDKSRGLWLRLSVPGFEGRPISLKRTRRGLAFRKGGAFNSDLYCDKCGHQQTVLGHHSSDTRAPCGVPGCPCGAARSGLHCSKAPFDVMTGKRCDGPATHWAPSGNPYCLTCHRDNCGRHGKERMYYCNAHRPEGAQVLPHVESRSGQTRGQRLYDAMTRLANDPAVQPGERENALKMRNRARTLKSFRTVVLVKSGCRACEKETPTEAESKFTGNAGPGCDQSKDSVAGFMSHVKKCGVLHSGLIATSGRVGMRTGYAMHERIAHGHRETVGYNASQGHSATSLMAQHGAVRLSGDGNRMGIEVHDRKHATIQNARDAADYATGHGIGVTWSCFGSAHIGEGRDAQSMHDHFENDEFHKSLALQKSIGDWGERKYSARERSDIEALPHKDSHVNGIMDYYHQHVTPSDWAAGEAWHRGAHQTVEERTGGEPIHHEGIQIGRAATRQHVAESLGAMSPRVGWGIGAFMADRVHHREMVGDKNDRGIGMGNSVRRARIALRGGGLGSGKSGKKTRALANAAQIPHGPHADHTVCDRELPIDVHADHVIHYKRMRDHGETGLKGKVHQEHSNAFRVAAARLGKEPHALHFASWMSERRRQTQKKNVGVRAAMGAEDSAGQPNVLRHTKLWPGSKGEPKLLMNSKAIWKSMDESGMTVYRGVGKYPDGRERGIREISDEVADHHGIDRDKLWAHRGLEFTRHRAADSNFYATEDRRVARAYARIGNEPLDDALKTAYHYVKRGNPYKNKADYGKFRASYMQAKGIKPHVQIWRVPAEHIESSHTFGRPYKDVLGLRGVGKRHPANTVMLDRPMRPEWLKREHVVRKSQARSRYKMPLGHPHDTEEFSAHDLVHRGARNVEQGFAGSVSLHDWGRSRYAEARHVARMHGLSITRTRDRSNPMKQHFELTPTVSALPHHDQCKRGCPGYEE